MNFSDDFCYFWRGKSIRPATVPEISALAGINRCGLGRSRALLLLHGFASSPAVFRNFTDIFDNYDMVLAPVLPGHATSISDFSQKTSADWIQATEQACAKLITEYACVDVIGFSLGGILAYHLSNMFPLNHLFLLAPAFKLPVNMNLALASAYILNIFRIRTLATTGGDILSPGHADLMYKRIPIKVILEILQLIRATSVVQLQCPTDLFLGRHDHVIDSPATAALFMDWDNVQLHWLEKSAHVLPLDGDAQSIVKIINQINVQSKHKLD